MRLAWLGPGRQASLWLRLPHNFQQLCLVADWRCVPPTPLQAQITRDSLPATRCDSLDSRLFEASWMPKREITLASGTAKATGSFTTGAIASEFIEWLLRVQHDSCCCPGLTRPLAVRMAEWMTTFTAAGSPNISLTTSRPIGLFGNADQTQESSKHCHECPHQN